MGRFLFLERLLETADLFVEASHNLLVGFTQVLYFVFMLCSLVLDELVQLLLFEHRPVPFEKRILNLLSVFLRDPIDCFFLLHIVVYLQLVRLQHFESLLEISFALLQVSLRLAKGFPAD